MEEKQYWTVKEVAEEFRVSTSALYELVRTDKKIPFLKIGASIRFDKEEITSYFKGRIFQDEAL